MAYDFGTMQTEVMARGYAYLNDAGAGLTRVKRVINDAAQDIDMLERWDYRRATATGPAPLTITDLGELEAVLDTTNQNALVPIEKGDLARLMGEITSTGTAVYYYLTAAVLSVYPVSTVSLSVPYWKVGAVMSGSTDVPLMPDRFRPSIVERACAYLYRDQDDPEMSAVCMAESDRIVGVMREYYALQSGGRSQVVYGYSSDW